MATRTKKVPVDKLTISEVKAILKEKNLSLVGTTDVLRARLRRRYELEASMTTSSSEEEIENGPEDEEVIEEVDEPEEEDEMEVEEVDEEEVEVEEVDEEEVEEEEVEESEDEEEVDESEDEEEIEEPEDEEEVEEPEDEEGMDADVFDYMETRMDDIEEKFRKYDLEDIEERMKAYFKIQLDGMFAEYAEKLNKKDRIKTVSSKTQPDPIVVDGAESKPKSRKGKFYECALEEFITEEEEEKVSDSKPYPMVTKDQLDRELKKYMSGRFNVDLPYFEEEGMSLLEFLDRRGEDTSKINYDTKTFSFKLGDENINLNAENCCRYETYINGRTVTFRYCRIQPLGSAWIVFLD